MLAYKDSSCACQELDPYRVSTLFGVFLRLLKLVKLLKQASTPGWKRPALPPAQIRFAYCARARS